MQYQLIAEGGGLGSFSELLQYGSQFREGERGELRLSLVAPLPSTVIARLNQEARSRGINMWDDIRQAGSTVYFRGVQGVPWIPIIVAILAIIAVILVIRWALHRVIPETAGKFEGTSAIFIALGLPLAIATFGPEGGRKAKGMLLGSLGISTYLLHYEGSRGNLPSWAQTIYNELSGTQPPVDGDGLPPVDGDGNGLPPIPPAPGIPQVGNLRYFPQPGIEANGTITIRYGDDVQGVVVLAHKGAASPVQCVTSFSPARGFPLHWGQDRIVFYAKQNVTLPAQADWVVGNVAMPIFRWGIGAYGAVRGKHYDIEVIVGRQGVDFRTPNPRPQGWVTDMEGKIYLYGFWQDVFYYP